MVELKPPAPQGILKKPTLKIERKEFIKQGTNIESEYEFIGKEIGKGHYGIVKKAVHKASQIKRAIKIIPRTKIKKMKRFWTEVAILRTSDHPNIIKLFEWFEDEKFVYLVMELCQGGELFDRIVKVGHFSEKEAAYLFKQMLHSMHYLHTNKICHRDLKPENFLFQGKSLSSSLKLIDFGLSKIFEEEEEEEEKSPVKRRLTPAGTPYYIAPEVLRGDYTCMCDMWSLGVILYLLLSGCPPFYGKNDKEILTAVKKGKLNFDREEWDFVSIEAKDLLLKLICKQEYRLTAEQALNHPWIRLLASKSKQNLSTKHISCLKAFISCQRLKKIVLNYIAMQLSEQETASLRKIFMSIDKDGNGTISYQELKEAMGVIKNDEQIKAIMKAVDVDKSGEIDYTEFLAATIDESITLNEVKLMNAFNHFDLDKNGKISAEELKSVIGGNMDVDDNIWKEMIREFDLDGDGEIDFDEFMRMMYTYPIKSQTKKKI